MDNLNLLKGFRAYLLLERGLSNQTFIHYKQDLNKWFSYLAEQTPPLLVEDATLDQISSFLSTLTDLHQSPASQARITSAIKSFYAWLVLEKKINLNPTDLIVTGKQIGRAHV